MTGGPRDQGTGVGWWSAMPKRRRSAVVIVGTATTALVGVAALAGGSDYDYQAVCTDAQTGVRVDDDNCDDDGGSGFHRFGWYYLRAGRLAPALGTKATGGSFVAPDPASFSVRRGGVSSAGGVVRRGGFGGRFGGFGG